MDRLTENVAQNFYFGRKEIERIIEYVFLTINISFPTLQLNRDSTDSSSGI